MRRKRWPASTSSARAISNTGDARARSHAGEDRRGACARGACQAGMNAVYLVGAGPGAPDLLTVRAVRLLGEADIVFHDALVPQEILVLAPQALKVAVGKRPG